MPMLMMVVIFAGMMYFLNIRPQQKKQQKHEDMLKSIKKGDTVITAGGFWGQVRDILDDSFIIELDENTRVRILKSMIATKKDPSTLKGAAKNRKNNPASDEGENEPSDHLLDVPESGPTE